MQKKLFWKEKKLEEMTKAEWESLCDRCGQCCLNKLENIDTKEIALTNVSCRYLDLESCSCTDYKNRTDNVYDCIELTPENACELSWMPESCAYRLLANGKPLYWWHPLVSGNKNTVHEAGVSVKNKAINEDKVEDLEDHVVDWINTNLRKKINQKT